MITEENLQLWSLDIKYAFLQVPQKRKTFVRPPQGHTGFLEKGEVWVLERLLPGQRAGTKEWGIFLQETLESEDYKSLQLSPNLFSKKGPNGEIQGIILVHVDDIQLAAVPEEGQRLKKILEARFTLTTQRPLGPQGTDQVVHFLKRKYEYDESGMTIKMGEKYIEKLVELLNLQKTKARTTPEPAHEEHDSKELEGEKRQKFATGVGVLLYMSGDRPDAQHGIRALASVLTKPTQANYKQLEHLVCYLKGMCGYALQMRKAEVGESTLEPTEYKAHNTTEQKADLLEVFTDSDWGGNKKDRKSITSCHFYLNGQLAYTLCRTQKAVALSSCEAECFALTTGASEAVFLRNCVMRATGRPCRIVLRSDFKQRKSLCSPTRSWKSEAHLMWPAMVTRIGSTPGSGTEDSRNVEKHC